MIELLVAALLTFAPAKPQPYPTTAQANVLRLSYDAPARPALVKVSTTQ